MGVENQGVARSFAPPSLTPSLTFLHELSQKSDIFPLESVRDGVRDGEGDEKSETTPINTRIVGKKKAENGVRDERGICHPLLVWKTGR